MAYNGVEGAVKGLGEKVCRSAGETSFGFGETRALGLGQL